MQRCLHHLVQAHWGGSWQPQPVLISASASAWRHGMPVNFPASGSTAPAARMGLPCLLCACPALHGSPLDGRFPCTLIFCSALQVGTMVQEHREEVGRLHEYIQVSTPVQAAVSSAQSAAHAAGARVV